MAPGSRERCADYLFYNPQTERAIRFNEAYYLIHAPRARLPAGHPVCWDFEGLEMYEQELDGRVGIG